MFKLSRRICSSFLHLNKHSAATRLRVLACSSNYLQPISYKYDTSSTSNFIRMFSSNNKKNNKTKKKMIIIKKIQQHNLIL